MALSTPTEIQGTRVACINVRGIINNPDKRYHLHQWLVKKRIDIVLLQETCVHHNNNNNTFPITDFPGYTYNSNNKNLETKILWRDNLLINCPPIRKKVKYPNGQWGEWISMLNNNNVLNISSFYHSPDPQYNNLNYECFTKDCNELTDYYSNKKCYFCISGDFNAESEKWSNKSNKKGNNLEEWANNNNFNIVNNKQPTHISANGNESAIDVTLVSDELHPMINQWHTSNDLNRQFGQQFDHYGIIFSINFEPNQIPDPITYCYNLNPSNEQLENYRSCLLNQMEEWDEYISNYWDDPNEFEFICSDFTERLKYSGVTELGVHKYHKRNKNWINSSAKYWISRRHKLRKSWNWYKKMNQRYARTIKRKINIITHKLAQKKARYYRKFTQSIETRINESFDGDPKLLHQLYSGATNDPTPPIPPQIENGKVVAATTEEIANRLHNHFNRKIGENEYTDEQKQWHNYVENVDNNYVHNNVNPDSIINRPFTIQEVLHAINTSNRNSAMGIDKIHQKLVYFAKHEIAPYLVKLWNYIYIIHSKSPEIWKYSDIFPIPKPGEIIVSLKTTDQLVYYLS